MRSSNSRSKILNPRTKNIQKRPEKVISASIKNNNFDAIAIAQKLSSIDGFTSVYHRMTFRCFREVKSGKMQEVIVTIDDAGPTCKHNLRYSCTARSDDGKTTSANSASTIDAVLAMVHWHELDD